MVGFIIAFFVICILMIVLACTVYEWNGIFIVEGILAGLAFWLADEIWTRQKGKKE